MPRLDLGPNPRRRRVDSHQHVWSLPDNPPSGVDHFEEARTEPVTPLSTPGDFLQEPLDPFANSMAAPSVHSYGQQSFSNAQLDFPYSYKSDWMSLQNERMLRVSDSSLNTSAYSSVPHPSFNKTYHPELGHNAASHSAVAGGVNGGPGSQAWFSHQQANHVSTQHQNNYCAPQPVNAFDE